MSVPQKYRHRKRMQRVDRIVDTVEAALEKNGFAPIQALTRWKEEMPTEAEMPAKDKYTIFDRKARGYRKGVHSEWSWGRGENECVLMEDVAYRGPEMDQGQPEAQSSWFLKDVRREHGEGSGVWVGQNLHCTIICFAAWNSCWTFRLGVFQLRVAIGFW